MAWRVARSLEVLAAEVHAISPKTTIYFIGDAAHQARPSDHNPNPAGVVCAEDIMEGHTDLAALAEQIRTSSHPDLAYLIYDRRIANRKTGFRWTNYAGTDPHTNHIHVSVGVGTDGNRVPPYDDLKPWGIAEGEDMTPAESTEAYVNAWRTYGQQNMQDPILIPANPARGVPKDVLEPNLLARAIRAAGGALSPEDLAEVEAAAKAGAEAGAPTHDELVAAAEEGANLAEDR